jgi:hypothetical protein
MAMEHWIDSDRCTCCILNTALVTMKYHEILDPIMIGVSGSTMPRAKISTNLNVGSPPDSKLFVKVTFLQSPTIMRVEYCPCKVFALYLLPLNCP